MTNATALRAFSIALPHSIVPIPVVAVDNGVSSLAEALADRFGLSPSDLSLSVVAEVFGAVGDLLGVSGMEFAGLGLFRSPDDPERPASVLVTGTRLPSDHESPEVAIAGLRDVHTRQGKTTVETLTLPAGPAVVVIDEDLQATPVEEGTDPLMTLTSRATAWIPDSAGTTVAVVSVISPSWRDWVHTCDLALDLLESFAWEEATGVELPA